MSKQEQSLNTYSVTLLNTQTEEDYITVEARDMKEAEEIVRDNYNFTPSAADGVVERYYIDSITQNTKEESDRLFKMGWDILRKEER